MKQSIILFLIVDLIHQCQPLTCPIYRPSSSMKNSLIQTCQNDCSFLDLSQSTSACLGVYINRTGKIYIKQLDTILSDDDCSKSNECLLEQDSFNSQMFSCCCSTDNCTLNWKIVPIQTTTIYPIFSTNRYQLTPDEKFVFSWKIFLILFCCLMILILISLTIYLSISLKSRKQKQIKDKQILIRSSSVTNLHEQLFVNLQQIFMGKYAKIYRTKMHEDVVVLKVYEQTNGSIWKNESSVLKSIKHPSIIKLLADGEYQSYYYLVFPYFEHGTLQAYLRTLNQHLTIDECLNYFRSLASAVAYLHTSQNLVHRDIKSTNILIDRNQSKIYLADFSLALELPAVLTEKYFVQIGTTRYMAPELLEGIIGHTREALFSVDVYALALVFWEILRLCEIYSNTNSYQLPYDEYLVNNLERSTLTSQLYDIVVVRRCRPNLSHSTRNPIIDQLCSLIEACWTADADTRMNAQSLLFKLNQIII